MNPLSSLLCMLIIAKEIGITLLVKMRSDTAFRRKTACFGSVSHVPCPPALTLAKKGNLLVLQLVRVNYGHSALYRSLTLALPMPSQPL